MGYIAKMVRNPTQSLKKHAQKFLSRMRNHRIIFQNAVQTRTPRLALVAPSTPSRFPKTPKALESRIPKI